MDSRYFERVKEFFLEDSIDNLQLKYISSQFTYFSTLLFRSVFIGVEFKVFQQ